MNPNHRSDPRPGVTRQRRYRPAAGRPRNRRAAARMSLLSIAIVHLLAAAVAWSARIWIVRALEGSDGVGLFVAHALPWIALSFVPGLAFVALRIWSRTDLPAASRAGLVLLPGFLLLAVLLDAGVLRGWAFWCDAALAGVSGFGLAQGLGDRSRRPDTPVGPVAV